MSETRKYTGGCHCGRVRYEVSTDLAMVMQCNCSICTKKSYLLHFVPAAQFQLLSGDDNLSDYQFNKHRVHHLFCKTCGIGSYCTGSGRDGAQMFGVNVRCLDEVDTSALTITPVDGKSF